MLSTAVILMLSAAPLSEVAKGLKDQHLAAGAEAKRLGRAGKYTEAAVVLEKFRDEARAKLAGASAPDAEKAQVGATFWKFLEEGIAAHRQRAQWAAKAPKDLAATKKLLLDLLERYRWDIDEATSADPRVQVLLGYARALDPKAKALFAPRKVKVVVEAKGFSPKQLETYAAAVAKDLAVLGVKASPTAGTEVFQITASPQGPISAHLIGDDVDECTVKATGAWKAAGLAGLKLEAHGFGDETVADDCLNERLAASAALAAKAVINAWAGQ